MTVRGDFMDGFLEHPVTAEDIYAAYPRKVARPVAIKAIKKAMRSTDPSFLLEQTQKYAKARIGEDPNFTPHPSTWFNQERYNDDPSTWRRSNFQIVKPNPRNQSSAPVTQYGANKPRAQREREEADRRHQEAQVAGQMGQAATEPLQAQGR